MAAWNPRANDIFLKALEIQPPAERRAYLDQACGGDAAMSAQVNALLAANEGAGSFLESPVPVAVATIDEPIQEAPGTRIGPYKLLEQIGEGGFGVVFMAEQMEPVRRRVALKVLKPGMDTRQVIARFEAERQALALMNHPNIAQVLDAGTTESSRHAPCAVAEDGTRSVPTTMGRPYFVMELVRGTPLTEYCDQNQLTIRERLELFVAVCQAVQHAHQKGIIHRDIKPSNVLVTEHDGIPVPKVIDFGVAKAMSGQLTDKTVFTGFAQMIGTPLYMSPEQAAMSGLDIDTRSDIYSLGVLLYELLTGTTPFEKERLREASYDELRRIIREEEPARPSMRISTLAKRSTEIATQRKSEPKRLSQLFRGELDWIVMKALEKDRTRRYETASAFAADVQRYLDDEPVLACPPSAWYRFKKFARRHKAGLATGATVVVAGLVTMTVLAISSIVLSRQNTELIRARKTEEIARNELELERIKEHILLAERRLSLPPANELWDLARAYVSRLDQQGVTIRAHDNNKATGLALSPDGRCIASCTTGTVRIWDATTRKETRRLNHSADFWNVAFSPDGRYLAAAGVAKAVVWDLDTGREVFAHRRPIPAPTPYSGNVYLLASNWSLVFSPDGRHLALGGLDGYVRVRDVQTGAEVGRFEGYAVAAYSPDGRSLATAMHLPGKGTMTEVIVYDVDSGRKVGAYQKHIGSVSALAYSPDGRYLVSAGFGLDINGPEAIWLWDVTSRRRVRSFSGHSDLVMGVAFSPDGCHIASASLDGTVKIWNASSGEQVATLREHCEPVYRVAFSPKGDYLASCSGIGGRSGEIKIWDRKVWEKK